MPAHRITVALNTNQSLRCPLLLPSPSPSPSPESSSTTPVSISYHALVVKAAQTKLRLKRPARSCRVFVVGTGRELKEGDGGDEGWEAALGNDLVVCVSGGEEYVGLKREGEGRGDGGDGGTGMGQPNPNCTTSILAHTAFVDALSLTQLATTARTLPGLIHAVAQPDLHPGTKYPIGAVFVSKAWIHPPLIGGDIGCGMAWYQTSLSRNAVDGEKGERWDAALGTIGAGNHFAEVQVVEAAAVGAGEDGSAGLTEDDVVLLVHSGSQGYGGDVLRRYTADGTVSLHESDPKAVAYMDEHERACAWARANRELITLRFLACLEPGEEAWDLGRNGEDGGYVASQETVRAARARVRGRRVVEIWHNNVEHALWPPHPPPDHKTLRSTSSTEALAPTLEAAPPSSPDFTTSSAQYPIYIQRKGAAPTYSPQTSLPLSLLPLPGSRATPTLILRPTLSAATGWGASNALSLAHGAGRSMSRAKALSSLSQKYHKDPTTMLQPASISQSKKHIERVEGVEVQGGT
ncbi:hypothetical protein B0A49_09403 [Cryomyces minteri]|uniref:3'-phosphate/5'-hydroxy nucleic acid ligase n=1 Tax=Cryomyces minteri TaxID=331657 RepID=A0A4U0WLZ5_9PEZI|nr:hypothetical protein B0A49_09403 [Cryomyces minteri]